MADGPVEVFVRGKRYPSDLVLVVAATALCSIGVYLAGEGSAVRAILGVPLLLFLPGYTLTAALWPAKKAKVTEATPKKPGFLEGGLETGERLILSVVLSIAIVVLVGLLLNYASEITLLPILTLLAGVTIACSAVAWLLRTSLPEGSRFEVSLAVREAVKAPGGTQFEKAVTVALVACIVVAMGGVAWLLVSKPEAGPYTEFYMLDEDRMLENLPKNLSVNETGLVFIGIKNHEKRVVEYTIVAMTSNATALVYSTDWAVDVGGASNVAKNATVAGGATFEQEYRLNFGAPGRYQVVWQLEIDGQPTSYRLHLWVDVV